MEQKPVPTHRAVGNIWSIGGIKPTPATPYPGHLTGKHPTAPNDEEITLWFVSVMANNNMENSGDNVITNTFTGTITGAPDPLVISLVSKMDVTCFGENNGTATVTTTGGTPPVTINWSNGQSGPTATNLTAGTYTATATDALGVMDDIQITIGQPPQLFVTIASETPITCSSPATITVEGQGGNPGYEYLWSTGTVGPTEILDNTFFVNVSVTDANGCVATLELAAQVDIDPPVISATGGNLTCNQPSVSIQASANSPCGIYSYSWTDPSGDMFSTEMSPIVSEPGIYSVVVTDLCNGCTASTTANVTSDMEVPLVSVIGTVDSISCLQPIVEITVTDLPSSSYSWTTTNGIIEFGANEATVGVSAGGSYTVLVTNTENGCTSSLDISVTEIEDPAGMVDSTSMLLCFGESNGYAALSSTGGIQPHVFTWPDGMSVQVRSDLSAGTYLVLLSDANGCVDSIDVIIDQPSALLANIGSTPESASGADDGVAGSPFRRNTWIYCLMEYRRDFGYHCPSPSNT